MTATTKPQSKSKEQKSSPTAPPRAAGQRLWEIDTLRGMAVITMIIFHLRWDLSFFGALPPLDLSFGRFWFLFQRYTAISFVLLVGLSLTLKRAGLERNKVPAGKQFISYLKQGLWIFGWGMVVTLVFWASGVGAVHFGVLHLIGFSIIAAFPLLRFKWLNLALWALLFVLGRVIISQQIHLNRLWLVWLGIYPMIYRVDDYFPVIPWFGVVLLGVFFGNLLYPAGRRVVLLPDWGDVAPVRGLRFIGRHTLPIYLLHQPVLIALLYAFGIAKF